MPHIVVATLLGPGLRHQTRFSEVAESNYHAEKKAIEELQDKIGALRGKQVN
jgi:hypothetical protein